MAQPIPGWFGASWGEIPLLASEIRTDNSRTQVVHELASGDIHPVQDRGLRARRVRCRLQFERFNELDVEQAPLKLLQTFKAAVDSGARAVFTHPVGDAFMASVGEFTYEIDEHSVITADVEFIQEGETTDATRTFDGVQASAPSDGEVAAMAAIADAELAKSGRLQMSAGALDQLTKAAQTAPTTGLAAGKSLSLGLGVSASVDLSVSVSASLAANLTVALQGSAAATAAATGTASANASAVASASATATAIAEATAEARASATAGVRARLAAVAYAEAAQGNAAAVTLDARVAVASWGLETDTPTRQILTDVSRISANIATVIETAELDRDLALWPVYRALVQLGDTVRRAAVGATSETPSVFRMRITEPVALLPLAARIYGGEEAQDRARQIANLNDVATPGWLPPGDYVMPARSRAGSA